MPGPFRSYPALALKPILCLMTDKRDDGRGRTGNPVGEPRSHALERFEHWNHRPRDCLVLPSWSTVWTRNDLPGVYVAPEGTTFPLPKAGSTYQPVASHSVA